MEGMTPTEKSEQAVEGGGDGEDESDVRRSIL